jgi:hypothetical protein
LWKAFQRLELAVEEVVLTALAQQLIELGEVAAEVQPQQLGIFQLLRFGRVLPIAGQQGANLSDHEIKGQLEHELGVHPAQRRVSLELPVGFELLAVETKMTADQLGRVW